MTAPQPDADALARELESVRARLAKVEVEADTLRALRDRAIPLLQSALKQASPQSVDARLLIASKHVAATLREPPKTRRDLKIHDPGRKFVHFCGSNDDALGARDFLRSNPEILKMRHCDLGLTPLHLAASKGATKVACLLVDEFNADLFAVDLIGRTPLHVAAEGLFESTCEALASRMGDRAMGPSAPVDMTGVTPSAAAALSGKVGGNKSHVSRALHRLGDVCVSPLPKPLPATQSRNGSSSMVRFGHYEMPGFRGSMEDASVELVSRTLSLFAVMDGHGGSRCALEVQAKLKSLFLELSQVPDDALALEETCRDLFAKLEAHLAALPELQPRKSLKSASVGTEAAVYENVWPDSSGTTLVLALVSPSMVALAHVGDSRAMWFNSKGESKPLTLDHRAVAWPLAVDKQVCAEWCARERARVEAKGATVNERGYVVFPSGHQLQMTRCLGDLFGKPDVLSAEPTVVVLPRTSEEEYVLLACDGIFDVLTEEAVAKIVLPKVKDLNEACYELCITAAMADGERPGSDDNLSVIIVSTSKQAAVATAKRVLTFDG